MNWLEISLTLDGELAEAVADVLARYAFQGVSIEATAIKITPDDEGEPVGPVRVRAFLPAEDVAALDATRAKIEQDLFYLGMIQPIPQPIYTQVADTDWSELWKANYKPIRIGQRLTIVPAWLADSATTDPPPEHPPIRLLMNPGMAFGTGTHPSTQLSLALLETYVKTGDQVLDVGCGSGILSVAAIKLGATSALGLDIDPEADRATRENAALNNVMDQIEFRLGSLNTILDPGPARDHHAKSKLQTSLFPIVVANILARVILKLLDEGLGDTVAPGGRLLLSGILVEQSQSVIDGLTARRFKVLEERQSGDWIALAAEPA